MFSTIPAQTKSDYLKGADFMQEIIYIIVLSFGSIITLFILTKLMGYRQMSEMSMFDYINGITIGSIAAEMATSLEQSFWQPFTAMVVYGICGILLSHATSKSIMLRRLITGKPIALYSHGQIFEKNLRKARLDLSELLTLARLSGYFDLSALEVIMMEPSGKLSFLPKSSSRPVTPGDLALAPEQTLLSAVLIMDGKLLPHNLKHSGKDEIWLSRRIHNQGFHDYKDILLALCDNQGKLTIYGYQKTDRQDADILI